MLVEIKPDIFYADDFKSLNYLVQIATYEHRYKLFVDIHSVNGAVLYSRLDPGDQDVLQEEFNKVVQANIQPNIVVSENDNVDEFELKEAIKYLEPSFQIILENAQNDKCFLEVIISNFN